MRLTAVFLLMLLMAFPFRGKALEDRIDEEPIGALMFYGNMKGQISMGDISDRFGNNLTAGGGFMYKTSSNYLFGLDYGFLFGGDVRENVLSEVNTSREEPINRAGNLDPVDLQQRGHSAFIQGGKLFPVIGPNRNSGVTVKAGAGFLSHWINLHYSGQRRIPQIDPPYDKGYDRLTYGPAANLSVGYFHFSDENTFNFFVEADYIHGFTQNQRAFNFDEMRKDDERKQDMLLGIRFGVFFPFFSRFWETSE